MFTFLAKNLLLHKSNLLYSPQYHRFISIPKNNSFTISYLINTCGLSHVKAISASKYLNFESPTNPDSVLTLFRNNGFSDSQMSKIIAGCPQLLLSSVDKSLKPKFEFFSSVGFSGADIAEIVCSSPNLLAVSVEKNLIPFFNLVKNIVGTDAKVITVFKRSRGHVSRIKVLASNVALLRDHNVPGANIAKLLVSHPQSLLTNASRFSEMVEEVEKMKFDPSEYRFLAAMQVFSMSRSSLEAKFDVYRSWGWSLDEVQYAFRMHPHCMFLSEKNIMSKMDYFVNKFGYTPSSIAKQPSTLLYSSERIVLRCSAIQILITNGKLEKAPSLGSILVRTEDIFFKTYISKFEKEVPELMSMYQGARKMIG
ncbi:hypothetical protein ACHQM5_018938 [Ranunculus cassubicifolius]